jgi:hypothetical protein
MKYAMIREYHGKTISTTNDSIILYNPNCPEAIQLKNCYQQPEVFSPLITKLSNEDNSYDRFYYLYQIA